MRHIFSSMAIHVGFMEEELVLNPAFLRICWLSAVIHIATEASYASYVIRGMGNWVIRGHRDADTPDGRIKKIRWSVSTYQNNFFLHRFPSRHWSHKHEGRRKRRETRWKLNFETGSRFDRINVQGERRC